MTSEIWSLVTIRKDKLTVFDEAEDGSVLHGDVHVEVFHRDIHLTDFLLIMGALLVKLLTHLLQIGDVFCIFPNASRVSDKQSRLISNGFNR